MNRCVWLCAVPLTVLLLSGCCSPRPSACPPVPDYSDDFKLRMAGELSRLGEDAATVSAIKDYAVLRAQVTVCRA